MEEAREVDTSLVGIKAAAAGEEAAGKVAKEPRVKVCCPSRAMVASNVSLEDSKVMATERRFPVAHSGSWRAHQESHFLGPMIPQPVSKKADPLMQLPPFQRLRKCLPWWQEHAPPFVLALIQKGMEPTFEGSGLKTREQKKYQKEVNLALQVMEEYILAKAAGRYPFRAQNIWSLGLSSKKFNPKETSKNRLISDCRWINQEKKTPVLS